ncbi:class I SAM-dependent methyltransferase [Hahella ganghwensis]|uniref:class I SAM-dependent methyltransferase n=1 Tax=Hahella ganghwensis TaxID=286420 RepID=UPI000374D2EA|nr:class I SAM-dependent methyltransferase [Hahella ganghwensis]
MNGLENTSQVLMRQSDQLQNSLLLVCPPIDRLHAELEQNGHTTTSLCWDFQAYEAQQQSLAAENRERCHFGFSSPTTSETEKLISKAGAFDQVILFMPKSKDVIELYLVMFGEVLANAGSVWLVGEKREGVESVAKKLKTRGMSCIKLDSARHCQLWEITAADKTFKGLNNGTLESLWQQYSVTLPDKEILELYNLPGVFSAGRLDDGTQLLLESLQLPEIKSLLGHMRKGRGGARILDFGCGCGVVGLSLKKQWPAAQLELVDVNALALESARCSAEKMGMEVNVYASDGLSQVEPGLSAIVTNPPFHQGVKQDTRTTQQFLKDCQTKLRPGGSLILVANRFLPYADWIEDSLGSVSVLAEDSRYKVYHARR